MVNKKKNPTKKLGAQELEKRKAPWASPITYRDGEGTGSATTETVGSRRELPQDRLQEQGPMPKPPIVDRIRRD